MPPEISVGASQTESGGGFDTTCATQTGRFPCKFEQRKPARQSESLLQAFKHQSPEGSDVQRPSSGQVFNAEQPAVQAGTGKSSLNAQRRSEPQVFFLTGEQLSPREGPPQAVASMRKSATIEPTADGRRTFKSDTANRIGDRGVLWLPGQLKIRLVNNKLSTHLKIETPAKRHAPSTVLERAEELMGAVSLSNWTAVLLPSVTGGSCHG
jgi:hypothetical protein